MATQKRLVLAVMGIDRWKLQLLKQSKMYPEVIFSAKGSMFQGLANEGMLKTSITLMLLKVF